MAEVKVKISKNKIAYKNKETGKDSEMSCIVLEFANGKSINLVSNRFNYKVIDYLTDLIDNENK